MEGLVSPAQPKAPARREQLTHNLLCIFVQWSMKPGNQKKKGLVLSNIPALYRSVYTDDAPLKQHGYSKIKEMIEHLLPEVFNDPEKPTVAYLRPKTDSFRQCLFRFYSKTVKGVLKHLKKPLKVEEVGSILKQNFRGFSLGSLGFENLEDFLKSIAKKYEQFKVVGIHGGLYVSLREEEPTDFEDEEEEDEIDNILKTEPQKGLLDLTEGVQEEEDKDSSLSWPLLKHKKQAERGEGKEEVRVLKEEMKQLKDHVSILKEAVLSLNRKLKQEKNERIALTGLVKELQLALQRKNEEPVLNFGMMGMEEAHERGFDEIKSIAKQ